MHKTDHLSANSQLRTLPLDGEDKTAAMVDPRNAPDQHFIDALRRRFPCEAEIDRVLTAKLKQRGRPDYRRESLDEVVAGIERLLRHHLDDEFTITNPGWLGGGASKIQVAFHLDWQDRGTARSRDLVLRMEPPASIVETSRTRECEA